MDKTVYDTVYNLSLDYLINVRQCLGSQVTGVIYMVVNGQSVLLNLDALGKDSPVPTLCLDNRPHSFQPSLILPDYSDYCSKTGHLGGAIDHMTGDNSSQRNVTRKFEMDFNGSDTRRLNGNLGNFIIFFKKICQDPDVRQTTRANYMYTFDKLKNFASLADFCDVNFDFLKKFEFWLSDHCGCNANTVAKHVKVLRKAVNHAIRLGYIDVRNNPFYEYSVRVRKTEKEVLSMNNLALIDSHFHYHFEDLAARDREILGAFLFACYTGLRFSDLSIVTRKHIVKRRTKHWLEIETQKTGKLVKIPLDDIFGGRAMEVIKPFNRKTGRLFVIPINAICNRRIKALLKKVHKRINYSEISFHTARRTMATLLLSLQVPITTVQTLLGHSSIKTTEVYAKVKDQTVYNDIKHSKTKTLSELFKRSEKLVRKQKASS